MDYYQSLRTTGDAPPAISHTIAQVLLISPCDDDHRNLREILGHFNWRQHDVRTLAEALALLQDNPIPVVICESELPDGTWRDLIFQLAGLPFPPMLVVTSRLADDVLWSEVLNLGGYNVLAKPLDTKEVLHVVNLAWLLWKSQWEPLQQYAQTA